MTVMQRTLKSFEFYWQASLVFGRGKVAQLGRIVKDSGYKKALLVTDQGLSEAGIARKVTTLLEEAGIGYDMFDRVEANPLDTIVEAGTKLAREIKPDVIIGLGGGSPMDTSKCIALLATNQGTIQDYSYTVCGPAGSKAKAHPLPLITIPTTSGTGSECNPWAVVTHTEKWEKMAIGGPATYLGGPCIAAKVAIDDPELTISLPPKQTASTGLDALSHLIEAYTANVSNPVCDALAEYGIRLVAENLPIAYTNGKDIDAREGMMMASCLGGVAFSSTNCAGMHCLGEALGGVYGNPPRPVIPHGVTCALAAPWIMEYNCMTNPAKFARIAELLGEDVSGLSLKAAALKSVDTVKEMINMVEAPHSLKELGVDEKDLPKIAERATWNLSLDSNPRVLTYDVFLEILKKEYEGW